jgi:hypothetical protein
MYDETITIEVVRGGFVLTYPNDKMPGTLTREVFTSTRKLNQKLKEVIETLSVVPVDTE